MVANGNGLIKWMMGGQTPRKVKIIASLVEVRHYPHSSIFDKNNTSFVGLIQVSLNGQCMTMLRDVHGLIAQKVKSP